MYHNPVEVVETNNWQEECSNFQEKLGIHRPLIITSIGTLMRQKLSTVFKSNSILSNVKPNPTFDSCKVAIDFGLTSRCDGVIAIGGGSVMDTAKVVMAAVGTGIGTIAELLKLTSPFENKVQGIFIPTTHGTGSEVTMWGTIWDMKEEKKCSISNTDLYPDVAILDGSLTLSLPLDLSLISVLDALSHSFEAIWNNNSNSKSTAFAIKAICLILTNIEKLKEDPQNIDFKTVLLKASNIAGLAFSNTKTAAAHSISYPLTIKYGIPHGIASSLPLIPLLHINKKEINVDLDIILDKLHLTEFSGLVKMIRQIPKGILKYSLSEWGFKKEDFDKIVPECFTISRMENNIVELTELDVRLILEEIL